jgi:hypothetical protein
MAAIAALAVLVATPAAVLYALTLPRCAWSSAWPLRCATQAKHMHTR